MIARGKGILKVEKLLNSKLLDEKQESVARKYQIHLSQPIARPDKRDEFWQDYHKFGFAYVAKRYLHYRGKYKVLMILYNLANRLQNKRLVQKIGNWLFY